MSVGGDVRSASGAPHKKGAQNVGWHNPELSILFELTRGLIEKTCLRGRWRSVSMASLRSWRLWALPDMLHQVVIEFEDICLQAERFKGKKSRKMGRRTGVEISGLELISHVFSIHWADDRRVTLNELLADGCNSGNYLSSEVALVGIQKKLGIIFGYFLG